MQLLFPADRYSLVGPHPFRRARSVAASIEESHSKGRFRGLSRRQRQKPFGKFPAPMRRLHEEAKDYLATARIGQPLLFASIAQQHGLSKGPARAQDGEAQRHQQHAKPGCHPAPPVIGHLGDGRGGRRG